MVYRADIVTVARKYIGVSWRNKGRSNVNGVDCIGLPVVIAVELGLPHDPSTDYPHRPNGTFISRIRRFLPEKRVTDAKDGDILVFAEGNDPCHAGIRTTYSGQPAVIHSHAGRRKVLEETLESAKSLIGRPMYCFEFRGIED